PWNVRAPARVPGREAKSAPWGAHRAAMHASDAWFGSAGSISFNSTNTIALAFCGPKTPPVTGGTHVRRNWIRASRRLAGAAASWPKRHHRAGWRQAGTIAQCLKLEHEIHDTAQVISDCSVWRHVYSKRLLVAEHARGPAAGSPHFLSCLIERFPS